MKESRKKISLKLIIDGEIIKIDFPSLEALDGFTVNFNNKEDLSYFIFDDENRINDVKVEYTYKKVNREETATVNLEVKYSDDNYDVEDLKQVFEDYIYKNPNKIKNTNFNFKYFIRDLEETNYYEISKSYLHIIINRMFSRGYKTIRNIYFELKKNNVEMEIIPVPFLEGKYSIKNDFELAGLDESNDDVLSTLLWLIKNGDAKKRAYAMEEISKYSLEALNKLYYGGEGRPIVDGIAKPELSDDFSLIAREPINRIPKIDDRRKQKLLEEICKIRDEFIKNKNVKKRQRINEGNN